MNGLKYFGKKCIKMKGLTEIIWNLDIFISSCQKEKSHFVRCYIFCDLCHEFDPSETFLEI